MGHHASGHVLEEKKNGDCGSIDKDAVGYCT